jgi:hypothetical protein
METLEWGQVLHFFPTGHCNAAAPPTTLEDGNERYQLAFSCFSCSFFAPLFVHVLSLHRTEKSERRFKSGYVFVKRQGSF